MTAPTTGPAGTTTHAPAYPYQESTMTTATHASGPAPAAARPGLTGRGLPFARLLLVELRKIVDTRSGRWLLIAMLATTAISMGITLWLGRDEGTGMLPLLLAANLPQGILVPVLGIMTAANEWSQRTALMTFTQEPRRLRVVAAKTLAATVLGLAVLAISSLVAVVAHVASMSLVDGGQIDVWLGWPMTVNVILIQLLGVLMGVALGTLLLNVPLAIVTFFVLPVISTMVFLTTAWLREHAAWFDLAAAQEVLLGDAWPGGQEWAQLGTTSLIWIALPLALGCWRVATREVK